jgi:hypothetical protein
MALTIVTSYSQKRYGRGVCFRLSFKWAALSLAGGSFNLALDSGGLNVDSTKTKHLEYRTVSAATESDKSYNFLDKASFDAYVDEDGKQAVDYINRWGLHFKGSKSGGGKGTLYNGVSVAQMFPGTLTKYFAQTPGAAGLSLVYGYYGHKAGGPAGHAVAYSNGKFFDSNSGIFDCSPPDAAGVDIDAYVSKYYTWPPEKFAVFVLAMTPPKGP